MKSGLPIRRWSRFRKSTAISRKVCAPPDTAAKWVVNLKEETAKLSFMPKRIPLTDEEPWHSEGIRRMMVKNHFVYFWIDEEKGIVWIIAVIYARRDQKRQLADLEGNIWKT